MIKIIRTTNGKRTENLVNTTFSCASEDLKRFRKVARQAGYEVESIIAPSGLLIEFTAVKGDECLQMSIERVEDSQAQSVERIYRAFISDELKD